MPRAGVRPVVVCCAVSLLVAGCGTRVRTSSPAAEVSRPASADAALPVTEIPAPAGDASPTVAAAPSNAAATPTTRAAVNRSGSDAARAPVAGPSAAAVKAGQPAAQSAPAAANGPAASGAPAATLPSGPPAGERALSPVLLGCVGTLTGPAGTAIKPVVDGAQVWVNDINARGGLNGHPVRLFVADDGGDPARHKQLVQEMAEVKKVIAFLAQPEVFTGAASVEYHTRARTPVIGGEGGEDWYYSSPLYFPIISSGDVLLQAFMHSVISRAVAAGKKKIGIVVCVEAQACRDAARSIELVTPAEGGQLVYKGQASLAQPDFTPVCFAAQNAAVETLLIVLDPNSISRLAAACARQAYRPQYATGSAVSAPFLRKDPNLNGMLIGSSIAPWVLSNTPGRAEFHRAMARYLSSTEPFAAQLHGWASGKLLERAVGASLPEPPTKEAVLDGLTRVTDDDLGGLTYPLTFRPNQNAERVLCWFNLVIQGGQFTSPDNGERRCGEYKKI